MATGGDWPLDDSCIARLATVVSTKHMVTIAESYMKISHTTIENIQYDKRDDAEAVNREIIGTWRNSYSGPDQRQVRMCKIVLVKLNSFFQLKDWVHKL